MSEKFEYKYDAPTVSEKQQIERIRDEYIPKSDKDKKFERLKSLHQKVQSIPTIVALILGVCGLLLFGVCMVCFLQWKTLYVLAVFVGLIGIVLIALAYPLYNVIIKKLKAKHQEEILKLSEELLKD